LFQAVIWLETLRRQPKRLVLRKALSALLGVSLLVSVVLPPSSMKIKRFYQDHLIYAVRSTQSLAMASDETSALRSYLQQAIEDLQIVAGLDSLILPYDRLAPPHEAFWMYLPACIGELFFPESFRLPHPSRETIACCILAPEPPPPKSIS
jgi:hypothetical protein